MGDKKRLFKMINDLPTIYEILTGTAKKQVKEKSSVTNHSSNKSKPNNPKGKYSKPKEEGNDEDKDEHRETLCGEFGENCAADKFWICCDICKKWFHGMCVKITPAKAEHVKQFRCPSCSYKRVRP